MNAMKNMVKVMASVATLALVASSASVALADGAKIAIIGGT